MTNVFSGIVKDIVSVQDPKMTLIALDGFQDRAIEEFRSARKHTCELVRQLTKRDEGKEK